MRTGAGDGKREYDAQRTVSKWSSGASLRAEKNFKKKKAAAAARKAAKEERRRNK